jgi:hypothetical protein
MKKLLPILLLLCFSCSKDDSNTTGTGDQLTLTVNVGAVTDHEAVINWNVNGNDSPVTFEIVLNGQEIVDGLDGNQYILTGLDETTNYTGKVFAKEQDGDQTFDDFSFSTALDLTLAGDYVVDTQEKADNFYFTSITGKLTIRSSNVHDISNLESLIEVGTLEVAETQLSTLEGLQNLREFYNPGNHENAILMHSNSKLSDISAISNLSDKAPIVYLDSNPIMTDITGIGMANDSKYLVIKNMPISDLAPFINLHNLLKLELKDLPNLTSLSGLNNLQAIEQEFEIRKVPNINNFEGMNRVEYIGEFLFSDLDSLVNFEGFDSLLILDSELSIQNLPIENLEGFDQLEYINGDFKLFGYALDNLQYFGPFPNLTHIYGNFILDSIENLSSINGLNSLVHIEGNLEIIDCVNLVSLEGLNGLQTMSNTLWLERLTNLQDISAFSNLSSDVYSLYMFNMPNLQNLQGLNSIPKIRTLQLINMDLFESLDGLSNLSKAHRIYIWGCNSLINLDGTLLSSDDESDIEDPSLLSILNNSTLTDFCGFTNYANNVPYFEANVSGNAYNPSEEQIKSEVGCSQ